MSNATATKCHSCQVESEVLAGLATREDRNHWMLWGCTCDAQEASRS